MSGVLDNRRGEGYIRTAMVALIAVVVGAVIVAGCYLLFTGKNGILKSAGTKIDQMLAEDSVDVRRTYTGGRYIIQYSFDSVNWKSSDIPGFVGTSSANNLISTVNSNYTVWLVSFTSPTWAYVCLSVDIDY